MISWVHRGSLLIILAVLAFTLSPTIGLAQTPTPAPSAEETPASGGVTSAADDVAGAIAARTPIPTSEPGFIEQEVIEFTAATGLADITFLGLTANDWINLGLSVLIFLLTYWLVIRFLNRLFTRLVKRTETTFDDQLLGTVDNELKWIVALFILRHSILRLDFLPNGVRTFVVDTFFVLTLLVTIRLAVKLLSFALGWYLAYINSRNQHSTTLDPAVMMIEHAGKLLIYIAGISIALSHFGLATNAISVVLIGIGVVVLFSVRDVMTDVVYGFIILIGQPFREGDAVHIASMDEGDWGWIDEIGSRDTRIRTRDNRTLVVPNSNMGTGEITNYSLSDPTVRVYTDLYVAYESDFDQVQSVLEKAARGVDDVLADKPVDILFLQYGPSMRIVRVRWWIATCEYDVEIIARVNAALEAALTAAKIPIPHTTFDLNVHNRSGQGAG